MRARTIAVAALLSAGVAMGAHHLGRTRLCAGFLPENDLDIPVGPIHADGVAESRFHRVLDRVQAVYGPIVASRGGNLVIVRRWKDGKVNAYAQRRGKNWMITMFGGLARHRAVTEEGFMLVACHELGHHLGGFPKSSWATNEGGSDYFSTLKCARLLMPMKDLGVDPLVAESCLQARGRAGVENCEHAAMAGLSLATLLGEIAGKKTPSFSTPDPTIVDTMMNKHPPAQCRLDTYFQGALCPRPVAPGQSDQDADVGACTAKGGDRVGLRPRCWYKPPEGEPLPGGAMAAQPASAQPQAVRRAAEALAAALSGRGV